MKKIVFFMVVILASFLFTPILKAQNERPLSKKELKKIEKQNKKEAKEKLEQEKLEKTEKLIQDTAFVFIATRVNGLNENLNRTLNFLAVYKKKAAYQFVFKGVPELNGVGGLTFNGKVGKYEASLSSDINKPSYLEMTFYPDKISGMTHIYITFYGEKASMDITLNNGLNLTFDGVIKPLEEARIYIGKSIF